jgi:Leucine-rich repeat (LRR) protein
LQDNKLELLPLSCSKLRSLEVLNVSFNALTVVPFSVILDMTSLQVYM